MHPQSLWFYKPSLVNIIVFCLCFTAGSMLAQPKVNITLNWEKPAMMGVEGYMKPGMRFRDFCQPVQINNCWIPEYQRSLPNFSAHGSSQLVNPIVEPLTEEERLSLSGYNELPENFEVFTNTGIERGKNIQFIRIIPIRQQKGKSPEKLKSATLVFGNPLPPVQQKNSSSFATSSVLKQGKWYRIGITSDGIYKLDYRFIKNTLGVDPSQINPQHIRVYGNGGGLLPFLNSVSRPDDLVEDAIRVEGESDGTFDSTDFVWFFGQGPHVWVPSSGCIPLSHRLHYFSDTSYYFINFDTGPGKRMNRIPYNDISTSVSINKFDEFQYYENEAVNILLSGRRWFGEKFENLPEYTFDFNFPNISTNDSATVKAVVMARSKPQSSFILSCQSASREIKPPIIDPGIYYSAYGKIDSGCVRLLPNQQKLTVKLAFNKNPLFASAVGYLDYLEVHAIRQLRMFGNYVQFRSLSTVAPGQQGKFIIGDAANSSTIIDVTNPLEPALIEGRAEGNQLIFNADVSTLREYVAFNPSSNALKTPVYFGETPNQDLHGSNPVDLIMVVHPLFWEQGLRIKRLHETNDGLRVLMATPQMIYNEFSSGKQDITSIKSLAKLFYDKASTPDDQPKYLLLFGDASYNNKNRTKNGNTDFIPSYQSDESLAMIFSYVSDDYFGLLDDNESDMLSSPIDIGIGRLPVKTAEEAKNVTDKIIQYETLKYPENALQSNNCNSTGLAVNGDWKNTVCFVADDQDNGIHMMDADRLATFVDTAHKVYNIEKIYTDFYKQFTSAGGQRYPDANSAINQRVQRGALIVNYTGHGSEAGWAQERILEVKDILSWKNEERNPFFVTATCEFSRFDDPLRTSAGEDVILQAGGGGIGLLTTTRLVYSGPNFTLNNNFISNAFVIDSTTGKFYTLGDLTRITKNISAAQNPNSNNHRNFTLLGDPAMRLNYPQKKITTTSVKLIPSASASDTLRALSKVEVKGYVTDEKGIKLSNFNGFVYPSIFDKKSTISNLRNDSTGSDQTPRRNFSVQKNMLYKGKASVTNGEFSFVFVVPKDIAYNFGKGKVSYYAISKNLDANGYFDDFIIGGTNTNAPSDNTGPEIKLFMNDDKFIAGSITDENPRLIAYINDENGINTVGSGIGHDIVASLNENNQSSIVLNDYYQSDLNSYQSGSIQYPFKDLEEGNYTLSLKVWDVYNNSGKGKTEFTVARSAKLALDHVMNYPNPFTTRTRFLFEHNRPCEPLDVLIQIFSVSGKLVKSIESSIQCEGYRSDKIEWDGRDDFGDKIGKGVYVYRIQVTASDGNSAEKFEKLVILN
jgi:hypothetical protein